MGGFCLWGGELSILSRGKVKNLAGAFSMETIGFNVEASWPLVAGAIVIFLAIGYRLYRAWKK